MKERQALFHQFYSIPAGAGLAGYIFETMAHGILLKGGDFQMRELQKNEKLPTTSNEFSILRIKPSFAAENNKTFSNVEVTYCSIIMILKI